MTQTIAKNILAPESIVSRLDLNKLFGRTAPVQVDLGCGDGLFLLQMAQLHPEKNFLGFERLAHRVAKTQRKANQVDNMRALRLETSYAVKFLLPEGSVETFYLLFPDPWPKRRHHRRRILTPDFLESIHRALQPEGILRIATDHADYFQQIEHVVGDFSKAWTSASELDCFKQSSFGRFQVVADDEWMFPQTKFEKKFRAAGAPIYRLSLRKISPLT